MHKNLIFSFLNKEFKKQNFSNHRRLTLIRAMNNEGAERKRAKKRIEVTGKMSRLRFGMENFKRNHFAFPRKYAASCVTSSSDNSASGCMFT